MTNAPHDKNWKLRLRFGQLKTPFNHFTVVADGVVGELADGFTAPTGPAWMAMKAWALSTEQAEDMVRKIGEEIGFSVTGRVYVYETEPISPPTNNPRGYDNNFKPYDGKANIQ